MNIHQTLENNPINKQALSRLMLSMFFILIPHMQHLPPALILVTIAFGLWRFLILRMELPFPKRLIRIVLTIVSFIFFYYFFGTIFGRDAGIALLTLMLGLKLVETRSIRDAIIIIYVGFFYCSTIVLFSQSFALVVYMIVIMIFMTAILFDINQATQVRGLPVNLRSAGKLFLQAIPIMLIMFFLFPRLPGPLWGFQDGGGSKTGLDDRMTPGNISNLSQSNAIAFRVSFDDVLPMSSEMYWRGPVLWFTDGKSWVTNEESLYQRNYSYTYTDNISFNVSGDSVTYNIILEPHQKNWLYALDMPTAIPDGMLLSSDYRLHQQEPVTQLKQYTVTSYPEYQTTNITAHDQQRALQLPSDFNQRTIELGASWRQSIDNDERIIKKALQYFATQPFYYTLSPPLLGEINTIDKFLFESRRGFCEHYATSFTVLMRAAGIPTRIVTGYQGGDYNPVGNYLMVRQRDAHAWAEVWMEDKGWVRVDPTSAVAPERIEKGVDNALDNLRNEIGQRMTEKRSFNNAWRKIQYSWDAINNGWNTWALGYDPTRQSELLSKIGITTGLGIALLMLVFISAALLLMGVFILRQRTKKDPVINEYHRFCNKLARKGIKRNKAEGPRDYANRVTGLRPDLTTQIENINRLYIALRYGPQQYTTWLPDLHRLISRFHP